MDVLNDKDKEYLLGLKPDDITFDLLLYLFADTVKKNQDGKYVVNKSRFNTWTEFDLKPNEYFNKEKVRTNMGLFIYNKLIVEKNLVNILGYINEPIDGKYLTQIENKLSKALLNDIITVYVMVEYLDLTQWLSKQFNSIISSSYTMKLIKPIPKVIALKKKLLKENKEKIKNGDLITAVKIEKELLKLAEEELQNDPGYDLYNSGSRGKFNNDYKNMSVMTGPIFDPSTGNFDIVENCLLEGIEKKDLPVYGNSIITGA